MIKSIFDFIVALSILSILLIPLVFLGIIIRFKLGSPIFFVQERPGKNGEIFKMIKFRTMKDLRDQEGELLPDEKRLTKFGMLLRKTSLDEFPELINVLKGDMSLVGPRPLLVEYLPLYNEFQSRRHDVKPGITGWAQIKGRNSISWEEKFSLDVWYVDHRNFFLDFKILILTIFKVLSRSDISSSKSVTMEKFTGE